MTTQHEPATAEAHDYSAWIGRSETRHDLIAAAPLAGLAATLDRDEPPPAEGTPVPPLWHWIYFNPQAPARELGPDGHPRRGGFLPPVSLPRRMWAGGRLTFLQPLRVGERGERQSTIQRVTTKQGRSGPLVFVTVRHELSGAHGLALTEEHDIVYREAPQPGAPEVPPQPAPLDDAFTREIVPDPVLLFRYSALTFNGHRIHFDQPYVTGVEGYPGLIVHGPLIATLLLDHLRDHLREQQPGATVARFSFKALRPVFDIHRFQVCGRPDGDRRFALWARDHQGQLAMQASAELA